jgi:hypothetical protein
MDHFHAAAITAGTRLGRTAVKEKRRPRQDAFTNHRRYVNLFC